MSVQVRRREALIFPSGTGADCLSGTALRFTSFIHLTRDFLWCSSLPCQWVPAKELILWMYPHLANNLLARFSLIWCIIVLPTLRKISFWVKSCLWTHISKTDFLLESPGAVCTRQHKQTLPAKESSCNAPGPYSWFLRLSAGSAFGFVSTFWQLALS